MKEIGRTIALLGVLTFLALLIAAPALAGKPGPGPAPVDWNRYHFKLDNSAFNDQETTITTSNVGRLKLLWKFKANGAIYGSPAVSGIRVIFGDSAGNLWILDKDTGALIKKLNLGQNSYGSGAYATPTVEGDFIYYQDAHGNLVKYNIATDTETWRVTAPVNDGGFSSPVLWNGKVYAGLSNGTGDNPCTVGRMQAFDKDTGAAVWSWDAVPSPYVGGGVWNSPAIDPTRNIVIFATGNPPNGSPSCGAAIPPNTPGDYTDSIVALDADTGALVWYYQAIPQDTSDLDFGGSSAVLFNDGTRDLVGAGSKNGKYYTVDRNTGTLAWVVDLNNQCELGCGGIFSAAGFAYGKLYLNIGTIFNSASVALDGRTGNVAWRVRGGKPQYGGAAIANNIAYMGSTSFLTAFDASTGAVLFSFPTGGAINDYPAVASGRVYFGSDDQYFYVLKSR